MVVVLLDEDRLEKKPFKDIHDQLATLADARRRLDERVAEKIEEA